MLFNTRKQLRTPAYRSFLFVLALSFGIVYVMPLIFRRTLSVMPWAIRVNTQDIDYQEYMREVRSQEQQLMAFRSQYGKYAEMLLEAFGMAADPRVSAYRNLVERALLDQAATDAGLQLGADYVRQKLADPTFLSRELATVVPQYLLNSSGRIDQALLAEYLKNRGLSSGTFEDQVEGVIRRLLVSDVVASTTYVPDFEIELYARGKKGRKKFTIVTVPLDDVLAQERKKEINDDELREFFDREGKKRTAYWVPEKRDATVWRFTPDSYDVSITDDDLKRHYDENRYAEYLKTPAKMEVRHILVAVSDTTNDDRARQNAQELQEKLLAAPDTFAQVAKNSSDDADTATRGGLVAPFARKDSPHDPAFVRAAFLLKNDGAISEVTRTQQGYEIIQRVRRIDADFEPFSKIKSDIKQKLTTSTFKRMFMQDLGDVIRAGEVDRDRFDRLVGQTGSASEQVAGVVKDDSKLAVQLFRLSEGDMGFYLDGDTGVVVEMTDRHERYLPGLATLKKTVLDDMREDRAKQKLSVTLRTIRQDLAADNREAVAATPGAHVEETGWVNGDSAQLRDLQEKGVPVRELSEFENAGLTMVHEGDKEGVVVRIDAIEGPEGLRTEEQKMALARETASEQGRVVQQAFVASLYRNATIETNESVLFQRN